MLNPTQSLWSDRPSHMITILFLGTHSVHTSATALREAEARISEIGTRLIQQGRI